MTWLSLCISLTNKTLLEPTWVMFGAKTMAILRAFILLTCSCWTTSAIRLIAQSRRAASVGGRFLASSAHWSSVWHCITCSGDKESRTPIGNSLNQALKCTRMSNKIIRLSSKNYQTESQTDEKLQAVASEIDLLALIVSFHESCAGQSA